MSDAQKKEATDTLQRKSLAILSDQWVAETEEAIHASEDAELWRLKAEEVYEITAYPRRFAVA